MSEVNQEFPFLLVIAQSVLERMLEKALRECGVGVAWNHRLDGLQPTPEGVDATVEELGGTAVGYIVPHWEQVVRRPLLVRSRFVIGADGAHSTVRQRLGITSARVSGPDFFAAYEFESDSPGEDELRIVMDDVTTNVLWPLGGNRRRWTFQMVRSEMDNDFPHKERRPVRISDSAVDEKIRDYVERVAKKRAPWFTDPVKAITWCTDVAFEQRFANEFGRNGCCLVGDSGHQTGPVGAQSMNVGLQEADALVSVIHRILRDQAPVTELDAWASAHG
jgi:2-polyprenyl-6-methoxyphenol hydroxylase-like FAD-dependent oxidoreductase